MGKTCYRKIFLAPATQLYKNLAIEAPSSLYTKMFAFNKLSLAAMAAVVLMGGIAQASPVPVDLAMRSEFAGEVLTTLYFILSQSAI